MKFLEMEGKIQSWKIEIVAASLGIAAIGYLVMLVGIVTLAVLFEIEIEFVLVGMMDVVIADGCFPVSKERAVSNQGRHSLLDQLHSP